MGVFVTASYVKGKEITHEHLVLELVIVGKHRLSAHVRIRLDVRPHHPMRNRSLDVLDDAKHVVVVDPRESDLACEELAQRASCRPDVNAAIYDRRKSKQRPYFNPKMTSGAR